MSEAERTLICLLVSYGATGVALGVAMFLGHKHKVKAHIATIGVFLVGFLITVYFADRTGTFYTFEPRSKAIHLPLAFTATACSLLPISTGVLHWSGKASLRAHHIGILVFLVTFAAASVTGVLMLQTRH
jgi:hypothetical protein